MEVIYVSIKMIKITKIALQKYTLGRVEVPPAQPKIHPRSAVTHPHLSLAAGCVWWFTRGAQRWSAGCTVGLIKRRGWVLGGREGSRRYTLEADVQKRYLRD